MATVTQARDSRPCQPQAARLSPGPRRGRSIEMFESQSRNLTGATKTPADAALDSARNGPGANVMDKRRRVRPRHLRVTGGSRSFDLDRAGQAGSESDRRDSVTRTASLRASLSRAASLG